MEVPVRVIGPMPGAANIREQAEAKPNIVRGVAVQREEYIAMGATPGRYGSRCIAVGDKTHKPHSQECRERVILWLKRQDDPSVQERLISAQMRMESGRADAAAGEDKNEEEEETR